MKQFRILSVQTLKTTQGKELVGIRVQGVEQMLIRSPKQFLAELRNSALIDANVQSTNSAMIGVIRRGLMGGIVFGEVDFFKAGSTFTIDENHPAITDKANTNFGKYKVGDLINREKDGFYADGLLSYQLNQRSETMLVNAVISAQLALEAENFFSDSSATSTTVAHEEYDPEEAFAKATGAAVAPKKGK